MGHPYYKVAFVVATKDRPDDLRRMLKSLQNQTRRPDQVVLVDASAEPVDALAQEYPALGVRYLRHPRPTASGQRNAGIQAVDPDVDLIGFLDDDAVLAPEALENMLRYWAATPSELGGCAFNLANPPATAGRNLKQWRLVRRLGLYSDKQGVVTPSGWHTITGTVDQSVLVEWLPSGASLWRRDAFAQHRFDEFFDGYSYLEDLDFSYAVGRTYRLAIVADALYWHYPASGGRINAVRFGVVEVRNRLYFVRKHGLSTARCLLGLLVRFFMTLGTAVRRWDRQAALRAWGNCKGMARFLFSATRFLGSAPAPAQIGSRERGSP